MLGEAFWVKTGHPPEVSNRSRVWARRGVVRAAAIDYGTVRVGLAVADELGLMAHPRPFLDGKDPGRLVELLAELASNEGIDTFIVGLPRELSGREGPAARRVRKFADALRARTGLEVELVDEWLSTREAAERLRQSGIGAREARSRIDSAAAAVLLQSFLDRGKNE